MAVINGNFKDWIRNIYNIFRCSRGNMRTYYKLSKEYSKLQYDYFEKQEGALENIVNKREALLQYSSRVSGIPFEKEREIEKKEIWNAIYSGKLDQDYKKEIAYIIEHNELCMYPYSFNDKYLIRENDIKPGFS